MRQAQTRWTTGTEEIQQALASCQVGPSCGTHSWWGKAPRTASTWSSRAIAADPWRVQTCSCCKPAVGGGWRALGAEATDRYACTVSRSGAGGEAAAHRSGSARCQPLPRCHALPVRRRRPCLYQLRSRAAPEAQLPWPSRCPVAGRCRCRRWRWRGGASAAVAAPCCAGLPRRRSAGTALPPRLLASLRGAAMRQCSSAA
mmetsp:Transcript_56079/g.179960  ORF Transcript_56079/g.179960 Transcript_56079/m.179960 type:complete len:201 (-) Transcript_56079:153-755(-)